MDFTAVRNSLHLALHPETANGRDRPIILKQS